MKLYTTSNKAGFTLAETMIASVIISLTLIPLVGLMGTITNYQKKSSDDLLSMIFVEAVTQTLQGVPMRPGKETELIWNFTEQNGVTPNPLRIKFPASYGSTSEVFLVGDETGKLVRSATEPEYREGLQNSPVSEVFLVRILLARRPAEDSASSQLIPEGAGGDHLGFEVLTSIEYPVTVAKLDRKKKTFRSHFH